MQLTSDVIRAVEGITSRWSAKLGVDWEDLQQAVFVKVLEAPVAPRNLGSWLTAIARYEGVNLIRQRAMGRDTSVTAFPTDWTDLEVTADDDYDAVELRADLEAMVSELPEGEQRVLVLWYLGYTIREAATFLEIKETTAKQRLWRAKRRLRASRP